MKLLKRNTDEFRYYKHSGLLTDIDEDGMHTGEFRPVYADPVTYRGNISSPSGSAVQAFDGLEIRYTHTLLMDKPDVDLTALSSTMVYSEVYNMMTSPDAYMGKTVKMEGQLAMYHDDATGKNYFACIISDATACCSQGIEFELTDEYTYPNDYPEVGEEICVTGTFDTYVEGEYQYCTLRNAKKCVM